MNYFVRQMIYSTSVSARGMTERKKERKKERKNERMNDKVAGSLLLDCSCS